MKVELLKSSILVLIIFICIGCNLSPDSSSGNKIKFTEQDNGKEITITLKDSVELTLNNTETESWVLDTAVNEYFKVEALPAIMIFPSVNAWQFKPERAGAAKIKAYTQSTVQTFSEAVRYFELKVQITE